MERSSDTSGAERALGRLLTIPISLNQVVEIVRHDIGERFPTPDLKDSTLFLVSEVGELCDQILRKGDNGYVRNRKYETDYVKLHEEVGDVLMMLITVANHLDVDMVTALHYSLNKVLKRSQ